MRFIIQNGTNIRIKRMNSDLFNFTKKRSILKRIEKKTKEKEEKEALELEKPIKKFMNPNPQLKKHFDNTYSQQALVDVADSVTRMILKEDDIRQEDKFYTFMTDRMKGKDMSTMMDRTEHIVFSAINQVNNEVVNYNIIVRLQVLPDF